MEVFLALNGVGRGHLTRALEASRWLRRSGSRPVIFLQGHYPEELPLRQPGVGIASLFDLPRPVAAARAADIARYAAITEPAVIIEDTHPAPVLFANDIRRVLMVRPVEMGMMRDLQTKASPAFGRFAICDDPGSPTWPFSPQETAEILRWPKWRILGPIFRRPTRAGIQSMRSRYRIESGQHVFVFSMGAGGEHPNSVDRARFLEAAGTLAAEIRATFPRPRLLFVCGPLFPPQLHAPEGFEEIREEPEMPSLLALAHGAVFRPGFNTVWESIAAGTPFLNVVGTTNYEPAADRLQRMEWCGLELPRSIGQWRDAAWLARYKAACSAVAARYSGAPAEEFKRLIAFREPIPSLPRGAMVATPIANASAAPGFSSLKDVVAQIPRAKQILIRMDDVVEIEPALEWLVRTCVRYGLRASLEIIPYLVRFDGAALNRADPAGVLEVSQHGYAHLPSYSGSADLKGEFLQVPMPAHAPAQLARGYRRLRRLFGSRFKGGYAAPYDGLPPWMPQAWRVAGGRYISWSSVRPESHEELGEVRFELDPWDWRTLSERSTADVSAQAVRGLQRHGSLGIVLHPNLVRIPSHRLMLERMMQLLYEGGCTGAFPSEAALGAEAGA